MTRENCPLELRELDEVDIARKRKRKRKRSFKGCHRNKHSSHNQLNEMAHISQVSGVELEHQTSYALAHLHH
jgi:hypothetical protein